MNYFFSYSILNRILTSEIFIKCLPKDKEKSDILKFNASLKLLDVDINSSEIFSYNRYLIDSINVKEILNFEGIEDGVSVANDVLLIWTEPQRMFGRGEPMTRGNHGSIRCTQQLSMVSGGHPRAQQLGRSITSHRPGTLTWAPVIRNLLEL